MIKTLCKFMNECGVNAFRKGERRDNFDDVVRQLKSTWKPTDSALLKAWPKYYCAKKLALLVHLHLEEQADSAARKAKDPNKYKGVVRNNGLRRLFRKLIQLYEPLPKKKVEKRRVELNKVHRTPSLNYQKSGTRMQDLVEFDRDLVDSDPCPVCGHYSTMLVDPNGNSKANAANERERRLALAEGGDGVVRGTSAMKGCFCYKSVCIGDETGKGCAVCEVAVAEDPLIDLEETACKCRCQVVFLEGHRRTINLAIEKNNSKKIKDAAPPPPGTALSA